MLVICICGFFCPLLSEAQGSLPNIPSHPSQSYFLLVFSYFILSNFGGKCCKKASLIM